MSLVARTVAQELRDRTELNDQATYSMGVYGFTLRRCTVDGRRSGGAVLTTRLHRVFESGPYLRSATIVRQLKAHFSHYSLVMAVARSYREIAAEHDARLEREAQSNPAVKQQIGVQIYE